MPDRAASRKKVVITIPLSKAPAFREDEQISLRHLRTYLSRYDTVFVAPASSRVTHPEIQTIRFPERFFGSVEAYNRLMLSREFYARFADYEFMLHYHLDALVFSDQLLEWCNAGYDYIAPPWFRCEEAPWVDEPFIGNGGFSLRRIDAFLKVFDSRRLAVDPDRQWRDYCRVAPLWRRMILWPRRYLRRHWRFNGVRQTIATYLANGFNEDLFWGREAVHFNPEFRCAPCEVARRFAFEIQPRRLYEENGRQLPFGCHAFGRYDRAFWEPFLLTHD